MRTLFVINIFIIILSLAPCALIAQNSNSKSGQPLDFIFKNYDGRRNTYAPKLEKHKIPVQNNMYGSKKKMSLNEDVDYIFKDYEGDPNQYVPKATYKNPHSKVNLDKNTNDKNLNFDAFLEVREFAKKNITLRSLPNKNGVALYHLKPGDMVKVRFTLHDWMRAQNAEKKNLGFWRKIKTKGILGEKDLYFFSHWREMQALTPYETVSLDILVPKNQVSVPVFSKPGYTNWRECSQVYQLCRAFIDTYSNVELVDAKLFEVDSAYNTQKDWELFYKVKFSYLKSDSHSATGSGWIPAKFAKRKIKPLSLAIYNLSKERNPAGLSSGIGINGSKKFFVFSKNKKNPHIAESRWLSSTSANQLKYKSGLFDQNFAIDAIVGANYTSLTQDFFEEGEGLLQYGINAGLGVSAPLYLDVDIEGKAVVSAPISAVNERKSTFIQIDQMFNFTIPKHWLNDPIKLGLGGYYYLMTNNTDEWGFRSLIGFHTRIKYDARNWHAFVRYAPIGVDLSGEFKDREISAGGGFKFDQNKGYESPYVNLEVADVFYRPNREEDSPQTIEMLKVNINYVHPF